MNARGPSFETKLVEARLIASSAEAVYAWWEVREQTNILGVVDELDEEYLASALLKRHDQLIALALARFAASTETVQAAFVKGEDPQFRVLRLAALSNLRCSPEWVQSTFVNGESEFAEWIANATSIELEAFLANPRIGDALIAKLLRRQEFYQLLSDERLRLIVDCLCSNPRMREKGKEQYDGY
jgi:hypothetical protein